MANLEVQVAVIENRVDTLETMFKETHNAVLSIKERLDKTNGAIPHMAEDIRTMRTEIKAVADSLSVKTSDIAEALAIKTSEDAKNNTKLNVLWGVIATLGSAIVVGIIRFFSK
jgi:hypothetical protein